MIKAIFYKEWLKTRGVAILIALVMSAIVGYCMLNINKVIEMNGIGHIWEVMITRDAIFIDIIKYVPLTLSIVLAISQYAPELNRSCLKLTLHLPIDGNKSLMAMQLYGLGVILTFTMISYAIMYICLSYWFAAELTTRVLLTALPWYLAAIASYLLISWICIEPTWKRRIGYLLLSAIILRLYFFYPAPESYNSFLPALSVFTFLLILLMPLSVSRFKQGKQD